MGATRIVGERRREWLRGAAAQREAEHPEYPARSTFVSAGSARRSPAAFTLALTVAATLLAGIVLAACGGGTGEVRVATDGDLVSVHYHGTLDSGEVFDSSRGGDPLKFVVGAGQMIAGFDAAVHGLAVGESVTVRLEAAQAYGEHRDDLEYQVPRDEAPEGIEVGAQVQLSGGAPAVVTQVTDEYVRVDANHPLAGAALTFEIELVSIQ